MSEPDDPRNQARKRLGRDLDKFEASPKTKEMHRVLTEGLKLQGALVVDSRSNTSLHRSVRNLARFDVLPPEGVNVESLLKHKALVITSEAVKALEGALA